MSAFNRFIERAHTKASKVFPSKQLIIEGVTIDVIATTYQMMDTAVTGGMEPKDRVTTTLSTNLLPTFDLLNKLVKFEGTDMRVESFIIGDVITNMILIDKDYLNG